MEELTMTEPENNSKKTPDEREHDGWMTTLTRKFTDRKTQHEGVQFTDASELRDPGPNYTGSLKLDINLGIPIPRGRLIEIYGNPGSGKSTLALSIAANTVAAGRKVLYIDQERCLSKEVVGMFPELSNRTLFQIATADSGDKALRLAEAWVLQWPESLVIIDSVDSLMPERTEDKEIGESDVGSLPKLMSDGARRLSTSCGLSGSTVIFLNQLRSNIGGYGNPDTTSGGRALGFYTSQRIRLKDNAKTYMIKDESGNVIGHRVRFYIDKNKLDVPFVESEFPLIYGKGIDRELELFELASELAFLEKSGNMWVIDGKKRHGKQVVNLLKSDPDFYKNLLAEVKDSYSKTWPQA